DAAVEPDVHRGPRCPHKPGRLRRDHGHPAPGRAPPAHHAACTVHPSRPRPRPALGRRGGLRPGLCAGHHLPRGAHDARRHRRRHFAGCAGHHLAHAGHPVGAGSAGARAGPRAGRAQQAAGAPPKRRLPRAGARGGPLAGRHHAGYRLPAPCPGHAVCAGAEAGARGQRQPATLRRRAGQGRRGLRRAGPDLLPAAGALPAALLALPLPLASLHGRRHGGDLPPAVSRGGHEAAHLAATGPGDPAL
ncbi:hypothetical protein APUTEX25_000954, partial [Auxenochlorella protothecoides]